LFHLPPPPPRTPPFPYTTLFRSLGVPLVGGGIAGIAGDRAPVRLLAPVPVPLVEGAQEPHRGVRLRELLVDLEGALRGGDPEPEDRKSTRLNSSHVSISYAVFCL